MPQAAAGPRIEPPVSLPRVAGAKPAAMAAAEPDDEPAGEQVRSHGLRAGGNRMSHDGPPWANSHVAFLLGPTIRGKYRSTAWAAINTSATAARMAPRCSASTALMNWNSQATT